MVDILLRNGADLNLKNCNGDTALHIAANLDAYKQPEKIIEFLLRYGANRNLRNEFRNSPLDIAIKKGQIFPSFALFLSSKFIVIFSFCRQCKSNYNTFYKSIFTNNVHRLVNHVENEFI